MSEASDPLDITIRKTYAQTKAVFIVIRNLQIELQQYRVEVQKLREDAVRTNSLLLALIHNPQMAEDVEAVARDLRIQTFKKE